MAKKKTGPGPQLWTLENKKKLGKLYPVTSNDKIAGIFGVNERSIRNAAMRFKFKKSNRYWDKPEERYLLDNWATMSPVEIADGLKKKFGMDKTKWAVINKYRELKGLR